MRCSRQTVCRVQVNEYGPCVACDPLPTRALRRWIKLVTGNGSQATHATRAGHCVLPHGISQTACVEGAHRLQPGAQVSHPSPRQRPRGSDARRGCPTRHPRAEPVAYHELPGGPWCPPVLPPAPTPEAPPPGPATGANLEPRTGASQAAVSPIKDIMLTRSDCLRCCKQNGYTVLRCNGTVMSATFAPSRPTWPACVGCLTRLQPGTPTAAPGVALPGSPGKSRQGPGSTRRLAARTRRPPTGDAVSPRGYPLTGGIRWPHRPTWRPKLSAKQGPGWISRCTGASNDQKTGP